MPIGRRPSAVVKCYEPAFKTTCETGKTRQTGRVGFAIIRSKQTDMIIERFAAGAATRRETDSTGFNEATATYCLRVVPLYIALQITGESGEAFGSKAKSDESYFADQKKWRESTGAKQRENCLSSIF